MHRLRTTADFVVTVTVALALCTLGALMLLFPTERLPEDASAYRAVGGVLRALKDESPRRGTAITFTVEGHSGRFVSTSPPTWAAARDWAVGRTSLQFFVLGRADDGGRLVPAYGVGEPGRQGHSLQDDIRAHNAGVTAWPAILALTLGVLGLAVVAARWRRQGPP